LPETEISCGATCQVLKHWVEGYALDLIIMGVPQKAFTSTCPNNNGRVSTSGCKLLPVFGVSETENIVFVALWIKFKVSYLSFT